VRRALHVALADFRARVRSRRLLVVLLGVVYLAYLVNTAQFEPVFQARTAGPRGYASYYGRRTSAFIGLGTGLVASTVFLFGGFYFVKGSIARDRATNVDEVVATTPVTGVEYLLGKWASGVGLFGVVVAALWLAAVANHAIYGVGPTRPLRVLHPILVLGMPVAALVTGVALAFESTRWLDGTLGNVSYFALVLVTLTQTTDFAGVVPSALSVSTRLKDVIGLVALYSATFDAIAGINPDYRGGGLGIGSRVNAAEADALFRLTSADFPAWVYGQRLGLVIAGALVAATAVFVLDRWEPHGSGRRGLLDRLSRRLSGGNSESDTDAGEGAVDEVVAVGSLTPVTDRSGGGLPSLAALELRAALRGKRWWWYLGAVGIVLGGSLSLLGGSGGRRILLPLALVWPVFVWSGLGTRVERYRTRPIVLSSPARYRQLVAVWLAGVGVTLALVGPVFFGTLSSVSGAAVLAFVGAVSFPPSFAVVAGVWTQSERVFEGAYLPLWYLALNGVTAADFAGIGAASIAAGTPVAFGALGALALAAALYRRATVTA
jgi:hypothetical protein